MKLRAHKEGVPGKLGDLHEIAVGIDAGHAHSFSFQNLPIRVVELVAMTVSLLGFSRLVRPRCDARGPKRATEQPQPHRAAKDSLAKQPLLFRQNVDHGMAGLRIDLGRMCAGKPADVAGELYYGKLHAVAKTEERDAVFARESYGAKFPFHASASETAGDEKAVELSQYCKSSSIAFELLRIDPYEHGSAAHGPRSVFERFNNGKIRVA